MKTQHDQAVDARLALGRQPYGFATFMDYGHNKLGLNDVHATCEVLTRAQGRNGVFLKMDHVAKKTRARAFPPVVPNAPHILDLCSCDSIARRVPIDLTHASDAELRDVFAAWDSIYRITTRESIATSIAGALARGSEIQRKHAQEAGVEKLLLCCYSYGYGALARDLAHPVSQADGMSRRGLPSMRPASNPYTTGSTSTADASAGISTVVTGAD